MTEKVIYTELNFDHTVQLLREALSKGETCIPNTAVRNDTNCAHPEWEHSWGISGIAITRDGEVVFIDDEGDQWFHGATYVSIDYNLTDEQINAVKSFYPDCTHIIMHPNGAAVAVSRVPVILEDIEGREEWRQCDSDIPLPQHYNDYVDRQNWQDSVIEL